MDEFEFRTRGHRLLVGSPPEARPRPARVADELALALQVQEMIDREGLTQREVAPRFGCSSGRICRLLKLSRLAPDIQEQVAAMMTETVSEPLDRKGLEWVAEVLDWAEQRERFRKVMNGISKREPAPTPSPLAAAPPRSRIDARRWGLQ